MMFTNATIFVFPAVISAALREMLVVDRDGDALQLALAEHVVKPVGPMELSSVGFASPYGEDNKALYQRVSTDDIDVITLTIASEQRVLPSGAVNKALMDKIRKFEADNARKPGGKMRRQMKDDLVSEMLPKAFVQPGRTDLYIDLRRHMVIINTASRKAAEAAVSQIREVLGSFPALPVNCEVAPRQILTGWVAGEDMPDEWSLGDECELRDPADSGAVVKVQRMELAGTEIDSHLEAGKQVKRLGLLHSDLISAVLDEEMVLRKVKLMDVVLDRHEEEERDDINAFLDGKLLLMAGALGPFIDSASKAFKWTRAE